MKYVYFCAAYFFSFCSVVCILSSCLCAVPEQDYTTSHLFFSANEMRFADLFPIYLFVTEMLSWTFYPVSHCTGQLFFFVVCT